MPKLLVNTVAIGTVGITSYFWGLGSKSKTQEKSETKNLPVPYTPKSNLPSSVNPQDFYKYGFPGPIHDLQTRQEFVSCYDRAKRNPYWIVEHITRDSIKSTQGVDRKKSVFREDEQIPVKFRNRLRDFFRSGYDRGHNAPAADAKFSQEALNETFYLTNISPQVGEGFNRDYWAHFEDFCRRLTGKYDHIRIMTGPLYLPKQCADGKYRVEYEVIGSPPTVAVPTHFFKLVVGENNNSDQISVASFVLPNDVISNDDPLTKYQVPVEALENASGLELLYKVPPNKKKDLCKEVRCEIIVREFPKNVNNAMAISAKFDKA
ncbi:nuclease [Yamadazyma tenuis]|uniref:Mitochondrial nuclease n=1 Tax=Candida tenuis (strain ATCC 10573 / BCRC 21748 / CBS 615 / JCM 9827 / NBRC 10315 / NRRL Y-1498 / VKM Y-70) TaxID=590646 RepID=G3B279_CANTC|nr:mitochondrial nuclease [Yamadazyma tenuis ATCC 10573]XP_006685872.1 uncharacterized protein CANTEDRAFT_113393 [Yamadazyma tenuis ATCC 10573]EGV65065.1 mitochondrial nuclease [Yamadazyma tenuis ATCC 10573]EGV65066.1 hypothetical protein CANTEDRAFT_113393 [Yamadazyma tenuis ATCC 10573]WEJ97390.1 nuclease [Yamadazyma tenuis]